MLRNYIFNGEGQLRTAASAEVLADLAAKGIGPTVINGEIAALSNITTQPPAHGLCPGWGHGPGGGGSSTFQSLDRDFADHRFPGNPSRYLWIGWNTHPNAAPGSQGSGWETGSTHCDPASWCDWRISFLEHGLRGCEELLGAWVGYSIFAMAGSGIGGPNFPVRPYFMTGYADNDFFLHDLHQEVVVTTSATEICGWFYLPQIPAGQAVVRSQFGIGFGLDTTCPTPPPLLVSCAKVCKWPKPTQPDVPASDIKYLVEKESPALARQRSKGWPYET